MRKYTWLLSFFIIALSSSLFAEEIKVDWCKSNDGKYIIFNAYETTVRPIDIAALLIEVDPSKDRIYTRTEITSNDTFYVKPGAYFYARKEADDFLNKIGLNGQTILDFKKEITGKHGEAKHIWPAQWKVYIAAMTSRPTANFSIGNKEVFFKKLVGQNYDLFKPEIDKLFKEKIWSNPKLPHFDIGRVVVTKINDREIKDSKPISILPVVFGEVIENQTKEIKAVFKNIGARKIDVYLMDDFIYKNGFKSPENRFLLDPNQERIIPISFKAPPFNKSDKTKNSHAIKVKYKDSTSSSYTVELWLKANIIKTNFLPIINTDGQATNKRTLNFKAKYNKKSSPKSIEIENRSKITWELELDKKYRLGFNAKIEDEDDPHKITLDPMKTKKIYIWFKPFDKYNSENPRANTIKNTVIYKDKSNEIMFTLNLIGTIEPTKPTRFWGKGLILLLTRGKGLILLLTISIITIIYFFIFIVSKIPIRKLLIYYVPAIIFPVLFIIYSKYIKIFLFKAVSFIHLIFYDPLLFVSAITIVILALSLKQKYTLKVAVVTWLFIAICYLILHYFKSTILHIISSSFSICISIPIDKFTHIVNSFGWSDNYAFLPFIIYLFFIIYCLTYLAHLLLSNYGDNVRAFCYSFYSYLNREINLVFRFIPYDPIEPNFADILPVLNKIKEYPIDIKLKRKINKIIVNFDNVQKSVEAKESIIEDLISKLDISIPKLKPGKYSEQYFDKINDAMDNYSKVYNKNKTTVEINDTKLNDLNLQIQKNAYETHFDSVSEAIDSYSTKIKLFNDTRDALKSIIRNISSRLDISMDYIPIQSVKADTDLIINSLDEIQDKHDDKLRKAFAAYDETKIRLTEAETKKEAIISTMKPVLDFFKVKDDQIKNLSQPEPQLIQDHVNYLENIDSFVPPYIINFEIHLTYIYEGIKEIHRKMRKDSIFIYLINTLLYGESGNSGLKRLSFQIGQKGERKLLLEDLKLDEYINLKNVTKKDFFNNFIHVRFIPFFSELMKIYWYRKIDFKGLKLISHYQKDRIDIDLLCEICESTKGLLWKSFRVRFPSINLFQDEFDKAIHTSFGRSSLADIFPDIQSTLHKLDKNKIYDIYSLGIESDELDIHISPKVIVKIY